MILTKEVYSEVYQILNEIGQEYIDKLPKELYNLILKQKQDAHRYTINFEIPLEDNKIKEETLTLIALFHLKYWCEDEIEKEELMRAFEQNEKRYQKELQVKCDIEKLLEDRKNEKSKVIKGKTKEQSVEMVVYKDSFYQKILNKIRRWLNISHK